MPLAEGSKEFVPQIRAQAMIAIQDADVIVMLVDSGHGITAADEEIAEILRRTDRTVFIAANKTDNLKDVDRAFEFYGLGIGEVFAISAMHGLGVGDLLDAIVKAFGDIKREVDEDDDDEDILKIAIVGRPNVGKSSTLNHLVGEERAMR
ncbi:MAG UNVERIFIED_CONTAM: 50S ribosome-binding GTPase [Anaerolineae bacterium]|jgi:GTP-binding protein